MIELTGVRADSRSACGDVEQPAAEQVRAGPAEPAADDRRGASGLRAAVVACGLVALVLLAGTIGAVIGQQGPLGRAAPLTGPAAVGFTQDMVVHLEQAVTIAAWARDHSGDAAVRELAAPIETTGSVQLGRMQGWLDLWAPPARRPGEHMAWMADAAADDHQLEAAEGGPAAHQHALAPTTGGVQMPGWATDEDLRRLRLASGPELDVLFLQLALRHHEGGEVMLDYGALLVEVDVVRELADEMLLMQPDEGDRMREMLAERGAAPLVE